MSLQLFVAIAVLAFAAPTFALSLNTFRPQHKLPPLTTSAALAGAAYEHARGMAK